MDVFHPSEAKLKRAEAAVVQYDLKAAMKPGLVDYKLVAIGKEKGLKGKELVEFVYEGLGGAPALRGSKAKAAKKRADAAKQKISKERAKQIEKQKTVVK